MAPRSKAAAAAAEAENDYPAYVDKPATDLQERYGDWLVEKLELEFSSKKEQAAFLLGVKVSTALRMKFQASPENQEVLEERRAASGAAKDEEDEPKPKRKAPAKRKAKAKAEPEEEPEESDEEPEDEDEEELEEAPKPAKRRGRPAKAAAPAKRKAKAATGGDAPF